VSRGLKTTIAILFVWWCRLDYSAEPAPGNPANFRQPTHRRQSRREVMQIPISTPTDVKVKAQMYWLSATSPGHWRQPRSSFRFRRILWSDRNNF